VTAFVHMQVSNRIHRLAVQVKDEVATGAPGDQAEADAEQARTKSKKKLTVGKVKSGERGREETATKGTAPERDKGAGTFAPATGRNKSVWSKQLEDLAVKAAVAKAEASKSVAVEHAEAAEGVGRTTGSRVGRKQSVRRSTKPPPSRRLEDVPRGRNSMSCTHGSARSNRGAALLDTRVRRDSVLPTGCTALLTRNQSQVDAGRSWLSHPAAGTMLWGLGRCPGCCISVHMRMYACLQACMHACEYVCVYAYILARILACKQAYMYERAPVLCSRGDGVVGSGAFVSWRHAA
jgi:hypothetical protein